MIFLVSVAHLALVGIASLIADEVFWGEEGVMLYSILYVCVALLVVIGFLALIVGEVRFLNR